MSRDPKRQTSDGVYDRDGGGKAIADERGKREIKLSETQKAQAAEAGRLLEQMRKDAKP